MDFPQRPEADDEIDREAIRRVRAGDGNAFSMIVSRYAPVFYSLAFRQIGSDQEAASEAVQEIFLKAYRALPSFDIQRRFFPWLYTIALNHLRSLKRSRKYAQGRNVVPFDSLSGAEAADKTSPPDDAVVAREGERLAQRALDTLPQRLREVFLLRHVEGFSTEEVASLLGVPEGTVRTWLFRARRRLREKLLESGWE
ncbi:MAG: sigma-70 family RNA polymerase sigma factor [Spirochaetia bacterium]|jgi:RNA polymerase sigma-70 factor (ECF subfamily)